MPARCFARANSGIFDREAQHTGDNSMPGFVIGYCVAIVCHSFII